MKSLFTFLLFLSFSIDGSVNNAHGSVNNAHGSGNNQKFNVIVNGVDEAAFNAKVTKKIRVTLKEPYDVIVVGGGLAGLSSALFLADAGKKVIVLEMKKEFGGLALGGEISKGIRYGRGASYFTEAYDEEFKILERIGMKNYKVENAIPEPIDSYLWNGKLYLHIWDDHMLQTLPSSFELFKYELKKANDDDLIPNQPLEEHPKLQLDTLTAAEWIRSMPVRIASREDVDAKKIYTRFFTDKTLNAKEPMKDVIDFLRLYCRSALGAEPEMISALSFANFYISEIETRFTSDTGTGVAAGLMLEELKKKKDFVTLRPLATVTDIKSVEKNATVTFVTDGTEYKVSAPYVVFASPLNHVSKIIKDFKKQDPERAAYLKEMHYAHYNVHNVMVKGHPYRATYDTWTRAKDYTDYDFADLILGRYMDPKIKGYEGMRDFKKHPDDDKGVFSLYHPLALGRVGGGYTKAQAIKDARHSVKRMLEIYSPVLKELYKTSITVERVETNRWPYSIHVAPPGHFIRYGKMLRKPFGRVFFANNNIGTPTFEEALFRGHCAANNILKRLDSGFNQEVWTRCPLEN